MAKIRVAVGTLPLGVEDVEPSTDGSSPGIIATPRGGLSSVVPLIFFCDTDGYQRTSDLVIPAVDTRVRFSLDSETWGGWNEGITLSGPVTTVGRQAYMQTRGFADDTADLSLKLVIEQGGIEAMSSSSLPVATEASAGMDSAAIVAIGMLAGADTPTATDASTLGYGGLISVLPSVTDAATGADTATIRLVSALSASTESPSAVDAASVCGVLGLSAADEASADSDASSVVALVAFDLVGESILGSDASSMSLYEPPAAPPVPTGYTVFDGVGTDIGVNFQSQSLYNFEARARLAYSSDAWVQGSNSNTQVLLNVGGDWQTYEVQVRHQLKSNASVVSEWSAVTYKAKMNGGSAKNFYLKSSPLMSSLSLPYTLKGSWGANTSLSGRMLATSPSGSITDTTTAETSSSAIKVLQGWYASPPLPGNATVTLSDARFVDKESNAAANIYRRVYAWVSVGDTNAVRGVLVDRVHNYEMPDTALGLSLMYLADFDTPVSAQAGDRVIFEVGYSATNTSSTSYNATHRENGSEGVYAGNVDTTGCPYVSITLAAT